MSDRYILALDDEVFHITDSKDLKKSKEDFEKEFYDVWVEDDNLYSEEEIETIVSGEYNDYLIKNSMSGKEITDRLNDYEDSSDELADINKVCDEYRIILVDNGVIDTPEQIKELTKHNNELFHKGKSCLKNLDNLEKAILEVSEKYKDNDDVRTAINEIIELKKEMDSHEKEKKKNL